MRGNALCRHSCLCTWACAVSANRRTVHWKWDSFVYYTFVYMSVCLHFVLYIFPIVWYVSRRRFNFPFFPCGCNQISCTFGAIHSVYLWPSYEEYAFFPLCSTDTAPYLKVENKFTLWLNRKTWKIGYRLGCHYTAYTHFQCKSVFVYSICIHSVKLKINYRHKVNFCRILCAQLLSSCKSMKAHGNGQKRAAIIQQ